MATCTFYLSVIQECSLPNITFGNGSEVDSGFLQQVSYDERDWMFGNSTLTNNTGPDKDNTEGDIDGLFAYLEGDCDPDESPFDCEAERVNKHRCGSSSLLVLCRTTTKY